MNVNLLEISKCQLDIPKNFDHRQPTLYSEDYIYMTSENKKNPDEIKLLVVNVFSGKKRWLDFLDESDQGTYKLNGSFRPLPFKVMDKPSGYFSFFKGEQHVLRRAELDFTENKCRVLEEIELPSEYPYCETIENYYISFSNDQESAAYEFISTDDKTGLKLVPVFHCAYDELSVKALFDQFMVGNDFALYPPCYIVQCRETEKEVVVVHPSSIYSFRFAGAMPKDGGLHLFFECGQKDSDVREIGLVEMDAEMTVTPCKKLILPENRWRIFGIENSAIVLAEEDVNRDKELTFRRSPAKAPEKLTFYRIPIRAPEKLALLTLSKVQKCVGDFQLPDNFPVNTGF